jgi:hypothetical protein
VQEAAYSLIPEEQNDTLRLLLDQAGIDAQTLLTQAGSKPSSAMPPTSCKS